MKATIYLDRNNVEINIESVMPDEPIVVTQSMEELKEALRATLINGGASSKECPVGPEMIEHPDGTLELKLNAKEVCDYFIKKTLKEMGKGSN